jgi:hypothetical protein
MPWIISFFVWFKLHLAAMNGSGYFCHACMGMIMYDREMVTCFWLVDSVWHRCDVVHVVNVTGMILIGCNLLRVVQITIEKWWRFCEYACIMAYADDDEWYYAVCADWLRALCIVRWGYCALDLRPDLDLKTQWMVTINQLFMNVDHHLECT